MTQFPKIKISDLTELKFNPREISRDAFDGLKASICDHTRSVSGWNAEQGFRLVGTITVNRQGKRVIGGHQRIRAIKSLGQDWVHADDITWVDIEPDSPLEKQLCVTLNNPEIQGDFTPDLELLLGELREEPCFEDLRLDQLLEEPHSSTGVKGGDTETLFEQAVQLEPPKEYMLIVCDDSQDWDRLRKFFDLQYVRRGGYKKGSVFDDMGIQRVIKADDFFRRVGA